MNQTLCATATFDSTHEDKSEGPHLHGHSFTVTVHELGDISGLCKTLERDLAKLVEPLHLHTLSDMLYGGSQTLEGIASWVMERLLMEHPRITLVEVAIPAKSARVSRELR